MRASKRKERCGDCLSTACKCVMFRLIWGPTFGEVTGSAKVLEFNGEGRIGRIAMGLAIKHGSCRVEVFKKGEGWVWLRDYNEEILDLELSEGQHSYDKSGKTPDAMWRASLAAGKVQQ